VKEKTQMCDCFRIGGPFIAEDPECQVHGADATRQKDASDKRLAELEDRVALLEDIVMQLRRDLRRGWCDEK
jgi:hypothetical protein